MKKDSRKKDLDLIERVLNGDERAYERLVTDYHNLVFGIVLRLVGNKTDAEDLVQEVFVKVYRYLDRYNGEFAFATWIIKIASNHSIDFLRKSKLKTTSLDVNADEKESGGSFKQYAANTPAPDKVLLKKEQKKIIEDAIDELPEKYRVIIVLRHTEEKNYDEIAMLLNIPIGTVKARLFRAREMLNKKLKIALKQ
ncbi:MAG: sigma-70 family RNA polymerase sigma factor [Calditrichia bacterium]|nr:sigma-70 family RNA polymerase sigma factor [Calditrichia bacterium]